MAKRTLTLAILKPDVMIPFLKWNETYVRASRMNPHALKEIESTIKSHGNLEF